MKKQSSLRSKKQPANDRSAKKRSANKRATQRMDGTQQPGAPTSVVLETGSSDHFGVTGKYEVRYFPTGLEQTVGRYDTAARYGDTAAPHDQTTVRYHDLASEPQQGVVTLEELQAAAKRLGYLLISERDREDTHLFLDAVASLRAENNPDVLDKVRAVRRDRQKQYGDSLTDFTRIAGMWSALLGFTIAPDDVPRMMICLKLSRSKERYKLDNMLDVIGYALCHEDLHPPDDRSSKSNS